MNPIVFALRRPVTVMMLVLALGLGGIFSIYRMQKDIFPSLNQPQLYVIHNYGGMDPKQIEGLITNVYELFFQYINDVEHVESRSIQSMVMLKLFFQPGTDMAEATAQTVAYCNRALSVMPVGSLPPYVVRLDAGSLPVGYLVFESESRSVGELQDLALYRVRPMFSGLAGVSSPPPFGGNIRTIVVNVDPDRLRSYNLSPQDVVNAIDSGNYISPSGNVTIKDQLTIVPSNTMVVSPQELRNVPLKLGENVYIRDVGTVQDATDIPVGYALVNGKKSVYLPVVKQACASTLTVVNAVKQNLSRFQAAMPDDVKVSYQFDESPIVYRAIESVGVEGALGAGLDRADGAPVPPRPAGRDHRRAQHPAGAAGLDRHARPDRQLDQHHDPGRPGAGHRHPGRRGDRRDREHPHPDGAHAVDGPRRAAGEHGDGRAAAAGAAVHPLGVHPVVHHAGGGARAVRAAVAGRRRGDGHVVPALQHVRAGAERLAAGEPPRDARARQGRRQRKAAEGRAPRPGSSSGCRTDSRGSSTGRSRTGSKVVLAYLLVTGGIVVVVGSQLGRELFPRVNTGQFQLRVRPPQGTHYELTTKVAQKTLDVIAEEVGPENVDITMGYAGAQPAAVHDQHGLPLEPGAGRQPAARSACARGAASTSSRCRSGCARCCPRRWARGSARSS